MIIQTIGLNYWESYKAHSTVISVMECDSLHWLIFVSRHHLPCVLIKISY